MADTPLKKEIAELRQMLAEAEETLRAITSGEVDALVVKTRGGEQIFTLEGADTIYRTAIENINEGILSLSLEGVILYSNHYFAQMMNIELNKVIGKSIFDFIIPECRSRLTIWLAAENARDEITLRAPDNTIIPAYIALIRLRQEKSVSLSAVITNLTQQKLNDAVLRDHGKLEQLVAERTRELRDLAHRLVDAQEQERSVIGSSLHDEIGQYLTYTTLLIDKAMRKADFQLLAEAKLTVQEAISKIRDLSSMLSPRLLRSAGLSQAAKSLIDEFSRRTKITVDAFNDDIDEKIPEEAALASYRILQESLTNIVRHAKASKVKVQLVQQKDILCLEITDNGVGFDTDKMNRSIGLTGMRERALALDGEFNISSSPGSGTHITATIPLTERKH